MSICLFSFLSEICDMQRIHFHLHDRDRYFMDRILSLHVDDRPITSTIKMVIESPTPQWYISYEYAYFSIARIRKGAPLRATNIRKSMLMDLASLVDQESKKRGAKWTEVLLDVICSPAPKMYITLPSARILFYKLIKKHKKK